ncbi:unnamed protein product, partial [Mesorhabditis spiculigera]
MYFQNLDNDEEVQMGRMGRRESALYRAMGVQPAQPLVLSPATSRHQSENRPEPSPPADPAPNEKPAPPAVSAPPIRVSPPKFMPSLKNRAVKIYPSELPQNKQQPATPAFGSKVTPSAPTWPSKPPAHPEPTTARPKTNDGNAKVASTTAQNPWTRAPVPAPIPQDFIRVETLCLSETNVVGPCVPERNQEAKNAVLSAMLIRRNEALLPQTLKEAQAVELDDSDDDWII